VPWREPDVDWSTFDAVLIRSTWDYHDHVDEFVAWADHVDGRTRLCNPAAIVRWNAHKGYLLDLERDGVLVVPTVVVDQTDAESLSTIGDRRGWSEVVVKPTVSAGAKSTGRYRADDPGGERALRSVLDDSDALVQPYLAEIETVGETSMVIIDGQVTHAIGKVPGTGDFRVQPHHGGAEREREPTTAELELASRAIAAASDRGSILYARVDCVTVDGQPMLMELELIEPALYLSIAAEAVADVLVNGLVQRAASPR
jgi:glutathione synthase/RimK-type ligase-like ATP-grasp enzyme